MNLFQPVRCLFNKTVSNLLCVHLLVPTFRHWSVGMLRGGPTFDPVPNFGGGCHVTPMHANSFLIQLNFS